MNWSYVSGFLDADGCVMKETRYGHVLTPIVSFANSELIILKEIYDFIKDETGYSGKYKAKRPMKSTHSVSYDLFYRHNSAVEILKKCTLLHPKKINRKEVILSLKEITPKNGKWKGETLIKRDDILSKWK